MNKLFALVGSTNGMSFGHKMRSVMAGTLLLLCASGQALAAPVLWNLSNVTFGDGGSASGSFVYDASTGMYSSVAITTGAGSSLPGTSYDTSEVVNSPFPTNSLHLTLIDNFGLADLTGQNLIGLSYAAALTDTGGVINLLTRYFNSFEGTCGASDCLSGVGNRTTIAGGQLIASVPEPATMALLAIGLFGAGLARRKRNS